MNYDFWWWLQHIIHFDPDSDWNNFWIWATIFMGAFPLIFAIGFILWMERKK